jgi:uncharacterized protein (TIGR03083 family)
MADTHIDALLNSVARLHDLVATLDTDELTGRAYPTEWSIADVLSHLGSGAVITRRRLHDAISGVATPDDFASGVWDAWNAKSPGTQRDDALVADAELVTALDAVTTTQRADFSSAMGPMTLDFEQFVGMRLNEHVLHTWDVEVVQDPTATLPQQVAALVIDNLELIARFTARPTGEPRTITITTTEPNRGFTIDLTADGVQLSPTAPAPAADVRLPAEAFARLVYGRLDADHTPAGVEGDDVAILRQVFPGP